MFGTRREEEDGIQKVSIRIAGPGCYFFQYIPLLCPSFSVVEVTIYVYTDNMLSIQILLASSMFVSASAYISRCQLMCACALVCVCVCFSESLSLNPLIASHHAQKYNHLRANSFVDSPFNPFLDPLEVCVCVCVCVCVRVRACVRVSGWNRDIVLLLVCRLGSFDVRPCL